MFCCFQSPKTPEDEIALHEKRPLLRSTSTKINYQTIVTVPYAHVLRDDKISIESSYLVEGNPGETYLLFNSVIPDQEYEKACFSFDDVDVSTPVVFATKTTNGHILLERVFQLNHVNAVNPSRTMRFHPSDEKGSMASGTIAMARPFDEFLTNSDGTDASDGKNSDSLPTKSDKN